MSSHCPKSQAKAALPTTYERRPFRVAHVLFEVANHPEYGATFALIAGEATEEKYKRPLFSGHIERGMGTQLRRLAHYIDELEAQLDP